MPSRHYTPSSPPYGTTYPPFSPYQSYKPFYTPAASPYHSPLALQTFSLPPSPRSYAQSVPLPYGIYAPPSAASSPRVRPKRTKQKRRSIPTHLFEKFRLVDESSQDLHFESQLKNRTYVIETLRYKDSITESGVSPSHGSGGTIHDASHHRPSKGSCPGGGVAFLDGAVQSSLPRVFAPLPSIASPQSNYIYASDNQPAYSISSTNKKGLGMFARCQIPAGGLIAVEHPLVVTPCAIGFSPSISEVYDVLFDWLSDESYDEAMGLSQGTYACGEQRGESVAANTMRTRSLVITLGLEQEAIGHRAVFPTVSRCNHSCSPNVKTEWDSTSFSLSLRASRPILAGEEITISYLPLVDLLRSRQERASLLRDRFGISTCHCSTCSMGSSASFYHSDQWRRALLRAQYPSVGPSQDLPFGSDELFDHSLSLSFAHLPTFEQWCLDPSLPDDILIQAHSRILEVMQNEGLDVLISEEGWGKKHIDELAMCYGALKDVKRFKRWIQKGLDIRSDEVKSPNASPVGGDGLVAGKRSKSVLQRWLGKPESFPVWGWRTSFGGSRHHV
ncbi:SET domain-containing protein [Pluteus cervinus]|uniref:SET domain-containing protein n=1 Tax=Pluteus cervinus TaxID=181527 RepID=A0ACD3ACP0_9AGAR|nr:SET domain-containing protein [Pluteus cervinus]